MDPSLDLVMWALLIALSRQSSPASVKAFTVLSPCHPLGQSGSARPPCLTTSGGSSETPSQRLHQPNCPCSALPPLPLRHRHFFCLLLQALCPSSALRSSTHRPRSHQPSEERPL